MVTPSIKSKVQKRYSLVQTIVLSKSISRLSILKEVKALFKCPVTQPVVTRCSVEKWSSVKNPFMIAVAATAMLFTSCQKEKISEPVVNSATANSDAKAWFLIPGLPQRKPVSNSVFGALIGTPDGADDMDFQMTVAGKLGISCLRERVSVPPKWINNTDLVPELNTQYKVLLNFNSQNSSDGSLLPFVSDMTQYKFNLNTVLNTFTVMPEVAVIENEESNRFYYSGTAAEYIEQLNAAIPVMHARGIKVANGGITSTGLCYLVYQDLLSQGKEDSAELFKELANVIPNSSTTQDRGEFVDELLSNYADMNLDYVNFHWKGTSPNTDALNMAINYLKKRTGKKIISNELGQFDDDPNTLTAHVELCAEQNLPYIVWYSPDENDNKKGTSLQYDNTALTPTGFAYQEYLGN